MLVFDVTCRVLHPIKGTDAKGHDFTIEPGYYRLRGVEHLIRKAAGLQPEAQGMDLAIVSGTDGAIVYPVTAAGLAQWMSRDDVEVTV